MLFVDASNDYVMTKREVMKKGQSESFVDDQGDLIWIALPGKWKLKLQKRGLCLAKDSQGNVIVFKKDDVLGKTKRYDSIYSFEKIEVAGDRFLISPQINNSDLRTLSKYLRLKFDKINKKRKSLLTMFLELFFPKKRVLAFN